MFSFRLSCISGYQRVAPMRYSVASVIVTFAARCRSRSSLAVCAEACLESSSPPADATTPAVKPYFPHTSKKRRRASESGVSASVRSLSFLMVAVLLVCGGRRRVATGLLFRRQRGDYEKGCRGEKEPE